MNKANPKVDGYLRKIKQWQAELTQLRAIILDTPLVEDVKWRVPCYTFQNSNVIILGSFKAYCVLGFVKGALLKDPKGILTKPGEDTQSARVIRFTSSQEIQKLKPVIKSYIKEAIANEKAGLKVSLKKITQRPVPEELQAKLDKDVSLKQAFEALTPGRRREYLMHISSAKQAKTRTARVEKCIPLIMAGQGLNDQYKAQNPRPRKAR